MTINWILLRFEMAQVSGYSTSKAQTYFARLVFCLSSIPFAISLQDSLKIYKVFWSHFCFKKVSMSVEISELFEWNMKPFLTFLFFLHNMKCFPNFFLCLSSCAIETFPCITFNTLLAKYVMEYRFIFKCTCGPIKLCVTNMMNMYSTFFM